MTELFRKLLEVRGVGEGFLRPKYEDLDDPFELPDMKKAVERMKKAADEQETVIIYGDYDVDGVTASVEMEEIMSLLGSKRTEVMLPDRFKDGYGMSQRLVRRAATKGASLVITVDCGSNNGEIIDALNAMDIDVVVTDHHEISGELPKAYAVVNPKRESFRKRVLERQVEIINAEDEDGDGIVDTKHRLKDIAGLAELCGAGVVFMVAQACVKKGWIKEGREKWLLDLAMIGTVCDSMKLTGDNRIICHYGMIVLEKGARKGLKELMRVAKISKIDTDAIGFQIGPRLNAAGRMESAELALRLLRTKSTVSAAKLAEELNRLNGQRRQQQEEATKEVADRGIGEERVLVVEGPWHEGVLGIIAGRLVETYRRPCFVISSENGKGSGRSFGDFNLALALSECQDLLEKGGGHAEACGLTVKPGKVDDFRKQINRYYDSLRLRDQERFLLRRADLMVRKLGELTLEFMDELALLEPFGTGNMEPVFLIEKATVLEVKRMGSEGQHLRLMVKDGDGCIFKLVAFFAPSEWTEMQAGEPANVWMTVATNSWNGETSVEGRIVRLEAAEDEEF